MKKTLILSIMALFALTVSAQKIAIYDYPTVLQAMPEYKTATAELETLGQQYQAELEDLQKEIQTKADKYQREDANAPQNIQDRHQQELQDMYQRWQQAQQDDSKAFEEAQQQKMQPVITKLTDAVAAVAKEGNYVLIIDKSNSSQSLYINEALCDEVTAKVRAKLGI